MEISIKETDKMSLVVWTREEVNLRLHAVVLFGNGKDPCWIDLKVGINHEWVTFQNFKHDFLPRCRLF